MCDSSVPPLATALLQPSHPRGRGEGPNGQGVPAANPFQAPILLPAPRAKRSLGDLEPPLSLEAARAHPRPEPVLDAGIPKEPSHPLCRVLRGAHAPQIRAVTLREARAVKSRRLLADTQGHRLQFMRSRSRHGTERSCPGKITCQGHSSNAGSDLGTLLTCSPLGEEIYNKQPPKIPKPPQLLQGSSLHHRASPRALHQTLISPSQPRRGWDEPGLSCRTIPRIKAPLPEQST